MGKTNPNIRKIQVMPCPGISIGLISLSTRSEFSIQVHSMMMLRAGYNYGKMPLDSGRAFENIAFPAVSEQHFTAGLGLNLTKKLTLNIGGMYSPTVKLTGSNAGLSACGSGYCQL